MDTSEYDNASLQFTLESLTLWQDRVYLVGQQMDRPYIDYLC